MISGFKKNVRQKEKKTQKCNHKRNLQQNTLCLDQQNNYSQENFTQPLVVMVETFRRSVRGLTSV